MIIVTTMAGFSGDVPESANRHPVLNFTQSIRHNMAGSLTVTCDKCKKVMQVPEVLAGKRIRCRGCEATLTVSKPVPPAAKVKAEVKAAAKTGAKDESKPLEIYEKATAYGIVKLDEQLRCAFCAADMEDGQVVCLNCGYNMRTRDRHNTRMLHVTTGGDYFLWHLPAVLCTIVVLCCIAGIVIVWTGTPDLGGDLGELIQQWKWGAVYTTCFLAFLIFISARFAVSRFFYHPHPPEIEKYAHEADRDDDD